jgi:hypothetical protein
MPNITAGFSPGRRDVYGGMVYEMASGDSGLWGKSALLSHPFRVGEKMTNAVEGKLTLKASED